MIASVNTVIIGNCQIKLLFPGTDSFQQLPIYSLLFFRKLFEIIFLMSFFALGNLHLTQFLYFLWLP